MHWTRICIIVLFALRVIVSISRSEEEIKRTGSKDENLEKAWKVAIRQTTVYTVLLIFGGFFG